MMSFATHEESFTDPAPRRHPERREPDPPKCLWAGTWRERACSAHGTPACPKHGKRK